MSGIDLASRLGALELFAGLDPAELAAVASAATTVELGAGATLVRQGEEADAIFVVLAGRLTAVLEEPGGLERTLSEMTAGSVVGEVPFLAGGRRTATVRAAEPSTLAVLGAEVVARLLEVSPAAAARVSEVAARRLRRVQLTTHLTALFPDMPSAVLHELGEAVEWVSLAAGEVLFRHGDPGDAAYLVVAGRVVVTLPDDEGGERVLGEIGAGEMVGEQAIILDAPRSATVYAARDTDLALIPRATFGAFVERHPKTMLPMIRTMVARGRDALHRTRRTAASVVIALVGLDLEAKAELEEPLVAALAALGPTIALDAASVDAVLHRPGIAQARPGDPALIRLRQWLDEVESTHSFVVYRADDAVPGWTERAVRQADHVVFFAAAGGDPRVRAVEAHVESRRVRRSLVLMHPAATARPVGTARWLAARDLDAVHHVRVGDAASFARLARILAGRAVGLVLGGGGARGFAHLGVVRALEELGVPIDFVGGSSIGATVAVPIAQGQNAAAATATVKRHFRALLDYTLPLVAMLSGHRITGAIDDAAGGWDIEDLWLPFFCISSSMTTARAVVHRRGNLAHAVRASVAIPGVLPPVVAGEELLVDGGVLNNLPIDVMRAQNPTGTVIAVHVVSRTGPRAKAEFSPALSGWGLAANRILPWAERVPVPSMLTTILRSMFVGAEANVTAMIAAGLADLCIHINASIVGLLQFESVEQVAEVGYESALPELRAWLARGGLDPDVR